MYSTPAHGCTWCMDQWKMVQFYISIGWIIKKKLWLLNWRNTFNEMLVYLLMLQIASTACPQYFVWMLNHPPWTCGEYFKKLFVLLFSYTFFFILSVWTLIHSQYINVIFAIYLPYPSTASLDLVAQTWWLNRYETPSNLSPPHFTILTKAGGQAPGIFSKGLQNERHGAQRTCMYVYDI